jgi:hypothetical protein
LDTREKEDTHEHDAAMVEDILLLLEGLGSLKSVGVNFGERRDAYDLLEWGFREGKNMLPDL